MKTTNFLFVAVACCITANLTAQVDTTKALVPVVKDIYEKKPEGDFQKLEGDLFELDLEALLNLDISSVLKKTQTIDETPAIATIVTAEQIKLLGARSVFDVLVTVPGFTVQDSYWKRQLVTCRGIKQTLYNDKILVLVDGVAAYDAAALEHYLDFIPLNSIQRIEIIRGPGSTIYGTNAFAAVINLITKSNVTANALEGYVKFGSFVDREVGLSYTENKKELTFHLSGSIKDNNGYLKEDVPDNTPVTPSISDIRYEDDNANILTVVKYRAFTLKAGGMTQKWSKFGPMPRHVFGNNFNVEQGGRTWHDKAYATAVWDKKLSVKLNLTATAHFDYSDQQADIGQFGVAIYQNALGVVASTTAPDYYRFGGKLLNVSAQAMYSISNGISLITGVSGEQRITTHLADLYTDRDGELLYSGSTKEMPFAVNDFGYYLNLDGTYKKVGYVAGVRISYLGVSEKVFFTPRVGLVYSLVKGSTLKLLYGEAFRGAGPQEQYYKVPFLIYGKDAIKQGLDPEKIRTIELALDQSISSRFKLRVNGFYNQITDLITRRSATPAEIAMINQPGMTATLVYDNLGSQAIYGGEFELIGYPTDNINFWSNFGYKDGTFDTPSPITNNDTTFNYIPFMENITMNLGVNFKFNKLTVSPSFHYVGERPGYLGKNVGNIQKVDAYNIVNVFVSYKISTKISISVNAKNLLNSTYFYPEEVRREILTVPGGPGFAIYGGINFKIE